MTSLHIKYGLPFLAPAVASLGLALAVLVAPGFFLMPRPLAVGLGLGLAGWGVYRGAEWRRRHAEEKALTRLEPLAIDRIPGALDQALYVGRGFEWTVRHAQRLMDLEKEGRLSTQPEKPETGAQELGASAGPAPPGNGLRPSPEELGGQPVLHGVGYLEEKDLAIPLSELNGHMFICGTTRVGKTRFYELVLAQAIRRGDCVIVVDPKWDRGLLDRMYDEAVRQGRERQFMFFSLSYPKFSLKYNPLQQFASSAEIADRIAKLLPAGDDSKPFQNFSWSVINKITEAMLAVKERPTLVGLKRYSFVKAAMQQLHDRLPAGAAQREKLDTMLEHNREHYGKMTSSLEPILEQLTSADIGPVLSPAAADWERGQVLDWERAIKDRRIVYVNTGSLSLGETGHAVAKMALQDFIAFVGRRYAYEKIENNTVLLVDEFHNVAWPGAIDLLNKAGGAGIRVALAGQTVADLSANLGKDRAQQVLGNTNIKVWLRAADDEIAEKFSKLTGKSAVSTVNARTGFSPNTGLDAPVFESDWGGSSSELLEYKVRPEWIVALPKGQAFMFLQGRVYKLRLPLLPPVGHPFPLEERAAG